MFDIVVFIASISDGQRIAVRLAKQIASTTESLKRAISKFNTHSRDPFEGTLYKLPQTIHWKDLSDCEGVELRTQGGVAVDCDMPLLNSAVRTLQMKRRAQEEIEMVKEDMKRSADFYVAEHSLLHTHLSRIRGDAQTRYIKGCINLLCHRLLQCEIMLSTYSKTFQPHISYEYPACLLISDIHNM